MKRMQVTLAMLSSVLLAAGCGSSTVATEGDSRVGPGGDSASGGDQQAGDELAGGDQLDVTPPDTTITAQPDNPTDERMASFEFEADEAGCTFECSRDAAAWEACSSPLEFGPLADGTHTFAVRAIDAALNVDPTAASVVWVVSAPPDTTITSGPPALTANTNAVLQFMADEPSCTFACALDGASWAACSSPRQYIDLGEGSHRFEVRATDDTGLTDPTPAALTWTVDTLPPDTTISEAPAALSYSGGAAFRFACSEALCSFTCALDGGAGVGCSSPWTYTGLADGPHEFTVFATDPAHNADPTPATHAWVIDTSLPQTTISAHPLDPSNSSSATFEFGADQAGCSFECQLDSAVWVNCASPFTYHDLADGSHTFRVRATNPGSLTDPSPASFTWSVDLTPPAVTISQAPAALALSDGATFSFNCSGAPCAYQSYCSLDGGSDAPCDSPAVYADLAEGQHTFEVYTTTSGGEPIMPPASHVWRVDTVTPTTTITSAPPNPYNFTSATFSFTASEANCSFECQLDGAGWSACSSPKSYSGLSEGPHTFAVRATDLAGHVESPGASHGWTVVLSLIAPILAADAGAAHACALANNNTLWCWGANYRGQRGDSVPDKYTTTPNTLDGNDWASLATGAYHTCAIKLDGTLWCWGANSAGQLGDNTLVDKPAPTQVTAIAKTWLEVSAGGEHSCGITSDHWLYCWGRNTAGQLGDGSWTDRRVPTRVSGLATDYNDVAAGGEHSCAVRGASPSAQLECWGKNDRSQVGDTTSVNRNTPTTINHATPVYDWSAVSAGASHSCAKRTISATNRQVYCWGDNAYGQLGINAATNPLTRPTTAMQLGALTITTAMRFEAGADHTCLTRTTNETTAAGTLACTGRNQWGQLGLNDLANRTQAVQVGALTTWTAVAAGADASLGVVNTSGGQLYSWGHNEFGQLGDKSSLHRGPLTISGGTGGAAVASGGYHACSRKINSTLWCWGSHDQGQLGQGTTRVKVPLQVGVASTWSAVAASRANSCGLQAQVGSCWGDDTFGQLGNNTALAGQTAPAALFVCTTVTTPVCSAANCTAGATAYPCTNTWLALAPGGSHACGIHTNTTLGQRLFCWGSNSHGQLGLGLSGAPTYPGIPNKVGSGATWSALASGLDHSCALDTNADLWCWGRNDYNQVNDSATDKVRAPVEVGAGHGWAVVAAGDYHTCAIDGADHSLWCWGRNHLGQLGDGTTSPRSVPTHIGTADNWYYLAAGDAHSCAINEQGELWCWGDNSWGQLGLGDNAGRTAPTLVDGGFARITAGIASTCAVKGNGDTQCWGWNRDGQVGDNTAWVVVPAKIAGP